MATFEGWLLKIGGTTIDHHFIVEGGWKSTPNQRLENDAWRDADADLHRETADHTKSKIVLTIKPLTLAQMQEWKNSVGLATLSSSDELQRRVTLTYWNDEDLKYATGTFYMADIDYTIKRIDSSDIKYDQFTTSFIEY